MVLILSTIVFKSRPSMEKLITTLSLDLSLVSRENPSANMSQIYPTKLVLHRAIYRISRKPYIFIFICTAVTQATTQSMCIPDFLRTSLLLRPKVWKQHPIPEGKSKVKCNFLLVHTCQKKTSEKFKCSSRD